ncbi:MAG: hypothetical protein ACYCSF_12305 [Acidimicrobiales bacterium]
MSTAEATQERVELSIPASVEWLALARTTGAAIASRWSFTYEEIADLRLAIDELCLTLVEGPPAARLELVYCLQGDSLRVKGRALDVDKSDRPTDHDVEDVTSADRALSGNLSARILDALVDDHGSEDSDGTRGAWLVKQRSAPSE